MALTRTAPYGVITNTDGTPGTGTEWTAEWYQGSLDLIDARWSGTSFTDVGTAHNKDLGEADTVLWAGASDLILTGMVAPTGPAKPYKPRRIRNAGSANLFLAHGGASTAGNQFYNFATSSYTPIAPGGAAEFVYHSGFWVLHKHQQGGWITPAYAGGDYTSTGGGTSWTVESGDVGANGYWLTGRTLHVRFGANLTTVAGSPTLLRKTLFGYSAATNEYQWARVNAGSGLTTGMAHASAGNPYVGFYSSAGGGGWTPQTNAVSVEGQWAFEVA